MLNAAEEIWWGRAESDWLEAFASHPKIGEKPTNNAMAAREQSGVADASAQTLDTLAAANRAYLEKFGYIFIVCAKGKTSDEMLSILQKRQPNSPADEIRVAAAEQAKITRLRLLELFS